MSAPGRPISNDPGMTAKVFYGAVTVILITALIYGVLTGNLLLTGVSAVAIVLGAIAVRMRAQGGGRRPPRRR